MKAVLRYTWLAPIVLVGVLGLFGCSDSSVGIIPPPDPPPDTLPDGRRVNVREFGARGDGVQDDAFAFEAALAALESSGGTLFIPSGTYILRPHRMGALEIGNRSNITLAGEGIDRSILRIAPGSYGGATHVILIDRSSHITIRDLTIDGNRPNATYGDQQSHGVEVRNSSDLRFEQARFMRLHSDGIRLVGRYRDEDQTWTERVVVEDSRFEDNGRSGVGMQRAVRQVQILNNTFERISDQSLSSEPGGRDIGNVGPHDILMEGNVIRHFNRTDAVNLQGPSVSDLARRVVFRNNRVENGAVRFRSMDDLRIEGNTILGDDGNAALRLGSVTNAQIVDNDISGPGGIEGLVEVTAQYDIQDGFPSAFPNHITLSNNLIRLTDGVPGIKIADALGNVTILGNEIRGQSGAVGIQVLSRFVSGTPRSGFTLRDNEIWNFERGIALSTEGDRFAGVVIEGNAIDHDQATPTETVGILFSKTGPYEAFAIVANNVFGPGIRTRFLIRGD
jgi:hypothetical protein